MAGHINVPKSIGMKSPFTAAFVAFMFLTLMFTQPTAVRSQSTTATTDTGLVEFPDQFVPVKLNLHKGGELSPQAFTEDDDQDLYVTCPDGYVGSGLFGKGFIHAIGTVQWQKVGSWETGALKGGLDIQSSGSVAPVTYTVYLTAKDISSSGATFAFTILHNGRPYTGNSDPDNWTKATVNIPAGQITELTVEDRSFNLSNYLKDIKPGDRIGLEIWCKLQGNVQMIYGSNAHPSHVQIVTNAIRYKKLVLTQSEVRAVFYDSFSVPPYSMKSGFEIDGGIYQVLPEVFVDSEGTQGFRWKLPEKLDIGPHVLRVSIAYDPQANQSFEATKSFDLKGTYINPVMQLLGIVGPVVGIVLLLIVVGVAWRVYSNKKMERYILEHPELLEDME